MVQKSRMSKNNVIPLKPKVGWGWWHYVAMALVLLSLLVLLYLALANGLLSFPQKADIQLLSKDEVCRTLPLSGMLIKEEVIIKAPASGILKMLVADGQRVRVGEPVLLVQTPGGEGAPAREITVYSPRAGVLFTSVDGLEGTLAPVHQDELNIWPLIRSGGSPTESSNPLVRAETGLPIAKVVDNLQPVIYYGLCREVSDMSGLTPGSVLEVDWQGQTLRARLEEIRAVDGGAEMIFSFHNYPDSFVQQRWLSVNLTTARLSGYLVPLDNLVYREGQPGLLTVYKQRAVWTRVNIEQHLDGKAAVSGFGLDAHTRYIANPRSFKEGDRVE